MLERIESTVWRNRRYGTYVFVEYLTANKQVLAVRQTGSRFYMPLHEFVMRYDLDPDALLAIFESGILRRVHYRI